MAPATDSLQKDSYSRYRAEMEKGMGGHGRATGMKDEGGKSHDEVSSTAPWVYPPGLPGFL